MWAWCDATREIKLATPIFMPLLSFLFLRGGTWYGTIQSTIIWWKGAQQLTWGELQALCIDSSLPWSGNERPTLCVFLYGSFSILVYCCCCYRIGSHRIVSSMNQSKPSNREDWDRLCLKLKTIFDFEFFYFWNADIHRFSSIVYSITKRVPHTLFVSLSFTSIRIN